MKVGQQNEDCSLYFSVLCQMGNPYMALKKFIPGCEERYKKHRR